MKIESFVATHPGKIRSVNEDFFCFSEKEKIWVVADGMGGASSGNVASKIASELILHFLKEYRGPRLDILHQYYENSLPANAKKLAEAVHLANKAIFNLSFSMF